MEKFDLENPLTSFNEHQADTLPSLFADESLHMPSLPFNGHLLPSSFRQDAISLISELSYDIDMDPCIPYLAVNYMDRFISKREIPLQRKPWILRLLVISCISLAAKMKNTDLPLSDFQGEAAEGCVCDIQSINRMEVIILTTLKWRMRSITPFSFLNFFLSLLNLDEPPCFPRAIKARASEILITSQCEIKLLGYKPSVIAASAILCSSSELFPLLYHRFMAAIFTCEYVNKGSLEECLGVMQDTKADTYDSRIGALQTSTVTPISVLDPNCPTSGMESSSTIPEGDHTVTNVNIKRRKPNGFLDKQFASCFQKSTLLSTNQRSGN